jgi:hypothetical protein
MNNFIKYAASFILGAVFCLLLFKSCEPTEIEIKIPEIKNELPSVNPTELDQDTIFINRWHVKDSIITIKLKNPVNDSLSALYKSTKNELDRYKLYLESIQIKKYSQVFNDEFINLEVFGDVQGDIKKMGTRYTLKERTIKAKVPQTVFRWTLGAQIRSDFGMRDPTYDITSGLQNRKGNILRLGYSKSKNKNYLLVGYEFSILNLKK